MMSCFKRVCIPRPQAEACATTLVDLIDALADYMEAFEAAEYEVCRELTALEHENCRQHMRNLSQLRRSLMRNFPEVWRYKRQ